MNLIGSGRVSRRNAINGHVGSWTDLSPLSRYISGNWFAHQQIGLVTGHTRSTFHVENQQHNGGSQMLRTALVVLLFVSPALAQDSAPNPLAAAGCGANEIQFDVKTNKKQHPTAQPEPGKALVFVIGAAWSDYVALHIGTPPTRFGVDGTWVGANGYRSYFFFSVEPGDHRLCTQVQSKLSNLVKSSTAAASFAAEAGKTYYFRTKSPHGAASNEDIRLVPVDPAEAQVLIAASAFSTFHLKK
ncbi:MAG: hypothetical protein WA857_21225 [Candidatus Acidiferrum sp.]